MLVEVFDVSPSCWEELQDQVYRAWDAVSQAVYCTLVSGDWAILMPHKPRLTEDWWNLQFFMLSLGEFGKSDLFQ